jgi:antitoxin SocA-like protein
MTFRLDIDKALAATAYLIQKAGGRFDVFVLLKTLYYADRTSLIKYGRTITGDKFVSMNKGPVLSKIFDLIRGKEIPGDPHALAKWKKFISERESHLLRLKETPELGFLAVRDMEILDEAFHTISQIPPYWLAEWTHRVLPEWEDPKGSSKAIDPVKILKSAKKSDKEIAEIEEELASINSLKTLLA